MFAEGKMKTLSSIFLTLLALSLLGAGYVQAEDGERIVTKSIIVSGDLSELLTPGMMLAQMDPDMMSLPHGGKMEMEEYSSKHSKRHEEKIGMFLIWRMINDIDIRDDQLDKFFPLMRVHQKQERDNAHKLHEAKKELKKLLDEDTKSESNLTRLTQNVIDMQKKIWNDRQVASQELMKILDPEQKARFILSVSGIEDRVRDSIARIKYDSGFDREKFRESLGDMNERLKTIREELKEKGIYIDSDSDEGSENGNETK